MCMIFKFQDPSMRQNLIWQDAMGNPFTSAWKPFGG